ncbi:MAG: acyl-CoA carboxylase subunit beta [Pyrinomonadaceae bacterium]|nr:acyl-CoA carboxylase subunit beta [Phycisphaerales bacterium]
MSSTSSPSSAAAPAVVATLRELVSQYAVTERELRLGGGTKAIERQHEKGRLTARERVALLVDEGTKGRSDGATQGGEIAGFQELGLWTAHGMYKEHGGAPAAGVVTGVGVIHGRRWMIIANDATVKAGAFFPMTCKKIIRAQTIAMMARLPLVYLVDSAGVFLPMQEDVFPDTDDFGRIFRNNAVISAEGIPQIAAIMGYCVAGGGYLPVLCDTLLMTEGSGLYLAGPALVKAAIGQEVTDEELGGASMHAAVSGTIDFREKDDPACMTRLRELVKKYPRTPAHSLMQRLDEELGYLNWQVGRELNSECLGGKCEPDAMRKAYQQACGDLVSDNAMAQRFKQIDDLLADRETSGVPAMRDAEGVYSIFTDKSGGQYDIKDIITCLIDARGEPNSDGHTSLAPDWDEYKADYGQSIVCGYAKLGGHAVGIVANQKKLVHRTMAGGKAGPTKAVQMPGVIYDDSADKSARFIMDCNQRKIPIVFLHDTTGFMVGRDSEQGGIIRAGAKMVNAMSNCVVPKIVVIMGGSYGAGNYAMCGRAFDPFMTFAWPCAKCAVMGANQATGVLTTIEEASRKRKGETIDPETHKQIYAAIHAGYTEQADIRHAASRGWVDRIIEPHRTREELIAALEATSGWDYSKQFKTGVLQT